jgi:flagellar assembly protein FliH
MPWSRSVLKKDKTGSVVMEFIPIKFELGTSEQALSYLEQKKIGSDFRMSDALRTQTGIDEIEKVAEQNRIEEKALVKLKDIQESAYKEAYNLGLEEGKKESFQKYNEDIEIKLNQLEELLSKISVLKTELEGQNEAHFIKLIFEIASKIAYQKIENDSGVIVEILRLSTNLAQQEESIVVRVAQNQFQFLEDLKNETNREFEFIKKLKFEPDKDIVAGGCVILTNYGEIDARVQERVQKLWEQLSEAAPKVKEKLAG